MREPTTLFRYAAVSTVLLLTLRPAHANGGHLHLGGVFFLLLGLVLCLGGLGLVLYLLLRASPEARDEERTHE